MNIEKQYIADVDKLVPRPDIALDVLQMAYDAESNIPEMAKKVEQDPHLTANMLRLANSSYYGHMREISSIEDIIIRLGLDAVKILAITGASAGLLSSPQEAYNIEPRSLWYHSYACAILSARIAHYAGFENTSSVYTAGLLHDIGKILLNKPLLIAGAQSNTDKTFSSIVELEHCMLKTDHARVGMMLLGKWRLPDEIIIPVGYHHTTEGEETGRLGSKIVYLANFLVESLGIRSIEPQDYKFNVEDFVQQNLDMPEVPNFQENMGTIMDEFFNQFNETVEAI